MHLAYIFARGNSKVGEGQCVLYCGPSNKSVDVVHGESNSTSSLVLSNR